MHGHTVHKDCHDCFHCQQFLHSACVWLRRHGVPHILGHPIFPNDRDESHSVSSKKCRHTVVFRHYRGGPLWIYRRKSINTKIKLTIGKTRVGVGPDNWGQRPFKKHVIACTNLGASGLHLVTARQDDNCFKSKRHFFKLVACLRINRFCVFLLKNNEVYWLIKHIGD